MATNIHERVLSELNRRAVPWTVVSRTTGIPYETLKKIASRRTPNPGVKHVQVLADYFDAGGGEAQQQARARPAQAATKTEAEAV